MSIGKFGVSNNQLAGCFFAHLKACCVLVCVLHRIPSESSWHLGPTSLRKQALCLGERAQWTQCSVNTPESNVEEREMPQAAAGLDLERKAVSSLSSSDGEF